MGGVCEYKWVKCEAGSELFNIFARRSADSYEVGGRGGGQWRVC